VYDLAPATGFAPPVKAIKGQLTIPEPTTVVLYDSQKMLLAPGLDLAAFAGAQWSDSIPKMLQEKLLQSFENYDIAHPPLRPNDAVQPDYQLLTDIRSFQVGGADDALAAEIAFSAKLIDKDGKLIAAKLFQQSSKLAAPEPPAAVAAFDKAFDAIAKELLPWTTEALTAARGDGEPAPAPARSATPRSSGTTRGR
jgi:phospholipid/cholesterol/gamma-HCH transport system substrate-binding protein